MQVQRHAMPDSLSNGLMLHFSVLPQTILIFFYLVFSMLYSFMFPWSFYNGQGAWSHTSFCWSLNTRQSNSLKSFRGCFV